MDKELKINAFKEYQDTKMPKGRTVTYELVGIKPDPDNKGMLLAPREYIRPFDTIEHSGKFYDIGIVRRYNTDGSYVLNNELSFAPADRFRINLEPGNPQDEEIYRFFEWCNQNESNENRRANVPPLFKRINTVAFAKTENEKRKLLFEAQQIFYGMKDEEIKNVANLLGIPSGDDIEVVKSNLFLKVENSTDLFLKTARKAPEVIDALVLVKKALKANILKHNKEEKKITFGDDNRLVFEYFGNLKESELLDTLKEKYTDVIDAISAQLA